MKVLIADDNPTNRKLLRVMLEAAGHSVHEAADGREALASLERESVDAIISDILMPNLDGYRLCYEVRKSKRFGSLPFIFYTNTYLSPSYEKLALQLGADKFLRKPASAQAISDVLQEATTGKRLSRPAPTAPFAGPTDLKEYSARLVSRLEEMNIELVAQNSALMQAKQQTLLQSKALETAANGIIITDRAGTILWANPAFTTLTGYTPEEVLGKTPRVLRSGQHDLAFYEDFWKTIVSGQTWRGEFINRRKDGSLFCDEHTVTPVRSHEGAITHFIGVMHDVTERKRSTEELRATHAQLRQLLEHSPAVIYSLRLEGANIVPHLVSQNMTELLGFAIAETLSHEWWIGQLHPEDRERATNSIAETLTHAASRTEYRLRHKDGSYRWVEDNRRLVRDPAGEPKELVGVWTDITGRKQAEAELKKAHDELLEASRFAGRAEVATSVLHNVGNVLNSVNVSAALITDRLKRSKAANLLKVVALLQDHAADLARFLTEDPKGKQLTPYLQQLAQHLVDEEKLVLTELDSLRTNMEHIKGIVAMQQNYAKASGVTESVQLSELVENALRMNNSSMAWPDGQVVREFEPAPAVTVDKHKVLQILINLLRNAKYACDNSGRADKEIVLRVDQDHDRVKISIRDNGIGVPAENLTRIFAHGFTTKKDGHGFGLHSGALAAKEMGGTLRVQSEGVGQGATFTLDLPINHAGRSVTPATGMPLLAA
jgi:PAS domain S-box-containing protein